MNNAVRQREQKQLVSHLRLFVSGLWRPLCATLYPIGLDCEAILAILGDKRTAARRFTSTPVSGLCRRREQSSLSHFLGFCETQHETICFVCRRLHICSWHCFWAGWLAALGRNAVTCISRATRQGPGSTWMASSPGDTVPGAVALGRHQVRLVYPGYMPLGERDRDQGRSTSP